MEEVPLKSEDNQQQQVVAVVINSSEFKMHNPAPPTDRIQRKWEVHAGKNEFYCNGRIVMARQAGIFYLTVFLIAGTSALFFAFDCPFLYEKVSPAVPVVGAILFIFTLANLFKTSFTDPGIIPRATVAEAADTERQIAIQANGGNGTAYRPPPRTKEIVVKNQTVKLKYCFTCKIFRPPRASHCSICDNCVDRFDHHCPWVGNCVGRRNYRYFYLFLLSLAALCVFVFASAITHLVLLGREDGVNIGGASPLKGGSRASYREASFIDAISKSPSSLVVVVICFFSVWSIIGLAGFHTYLASSNLTTNEDIKGSYSSKRNHENFNPFSKGNFISNCFDVLCAPLNPSLIDARGIVTEQYLAANAYNQGVEGGYGGDISSQQQATSLTYGSVVNPSTGLPHSVQDGNARHLNGLKAQQNPLHAEHTELTSVNVSLHNGLNEEIVGHRASVMSPDDADPPPRIPSSANGAYNADLDQTTMIGSALDLDSLGGGDDDEQDNGSSTVTSGSQIGLIHPPSREHNRIVTRQGIAGHV